MQQAQNLGVANYYHVECFDIHGKLKWEEKFKNIVVDEGLNDILTNYWKGAAYTAAHYVGLTDGTPTPAASDNMTIHTGWAEVVPYSEGTRQALTLGAVAAKSVDNSASKASFSINATATVGGIFIPTNSTKSGTTGLLIAVAAFASDKAVESGDTINVTATLTASAA